MYYILGIKSQPRGYNMPKRLNIEKTEYVNKMAEFMHANHTSFWTLDETREKWRKLRQYDKKIESELISQSILFMSLLNSELNHDFRAKMLNFIARHLSVYVARAPEFNGDEKKACTQLNSFFTAWLKMAEKRKSDSKANAKKRQAPVVKAQKKQKPANKKCDRHLSTGSDGKIVQKITIKTEGKVTTIETVYDNLKEYQRNHRADFQRIIREHVK
jgi:hypothetical protein